MLRQALLGTQRARGIASFAALRASRPLMMVRSAIKVKFEEAGGRKPQQSVRLPHRGGRAPASSLSRFACSSTLDGEMGHMEPAEAFELLQTEGWKFVDCRTEEEFASGHVEDSVNIPVVYFSDAGMVPNDKFVEQLRAEVPDKSTKLIMGCKIGQRSMLASQLALNDDYEEVHNMTGGMMQWASSGLPIKN